MRPSVTGASAVLLVTVLIATCLVIVPEDSSAVPAVHDGRYGGTIKASTDENPAVVDEFQSFIDYVSDHLKHYTINTFDPHLLTETSFRRDVKVEGTDYRSTDRITGYVEVKMDSDISGFFPAEGKYYAKQNESTVGFIYRVFADNGAPNERSAQLRMDIRIYFDVTLETHVDTYTNRMTDASLGIKLSMHDKEYNDIKVKIEKYEDGSPEYMTIDYAEHSVDSMLYIDFGLSMDMEDMIMDSSTPTWDVTPLVVEHVDRSIVSSDLADSVWAMVLQSAGDGMGSVELPELILKLLGSGSRMLDLFETIKSLTSTDVPDIGFKLGFTASDHNDGTYDYCRLTSVRDAHNEYDFPWNGYILDMRRVVALIPDGVIPEERKLVIDGVIDALGWNAINVHDISSDPETEQNCARIQSYVASVMEKDEATDYHTPEVYIYVACAGIIAICAVMILIWRRVI
jgi:hypothetical protein